MKIYAVTHRNPVYLKAVYQSWITLVNTEDEIPSGFRYLSWQDGYRVWRMTHERVPIPLGRVPDISCAIYLIRR